METYIEVKRCARCRESKPLELFCRNRRQPDGRHNYCKVCKAEMSKGYYQRWTPEQREKQRKRVLRTRYAVEIGLIEQLYEMQEGCCSICGKHGESPGAVDHGDRMKVLHIDHDHKTGGIRGLLCIGCNIGLGGFRDDPVALVSAAHYLQQKRGQ